MTEQSDNKIIKQALLLETKQRTEFLAQLEDGELKEKVKYLLNDDKELTQFVLETSAATQALETHRLKDLKPGDRIKQFIIVKLIAKGGMGSVYLAYDEKLKRNVAIKTIRTEYIKNQATQQRFKQEAQILSQINHPSICQIYEYLDYIDGNLLVLELVSGVTLNNINLSNQEKLDVFMQIASALEVAHGKDVIHRDLKPDNIMYSDNNKIKILDFGIAKSSIMNKKDQSEFDDIEHLTGQPLTKMGTLMGTLLYMSPEQAQGQEVSKASDIYSLGIIMQEILTGATVYDLTDSKDLKQQVIEAKHVNTELIPKNYKKLITALTQKDPNNRPSAIDLVKTLKEIKEIPKRRLKNILLASALIFALLGFSKYTYDLNLQKNAAEQARIVAETARAKAEKSQQESEKVTEFLENLFLVSDPYANDGKELTAKQMLDKGSKNINDELANQPKILFILKATIGAIYSQLGEYETAQRHFDEVAQLIANDLEIDDAQHIEFLSKQAALYYETRAADKMQDTLLKGIKIAKNNKTLAKHYYFNLLFNLGVVYADKSQIEEAFKAYRDSLDFYLTEPEEYKYKIIENYNSQGLLYANIGNHKKAVEYLETALSMVNPIEDQDLDYKSTIKGNLSYILSNLGQHEKAIAYGLSIIELRKNLLGENHLLLALAYDNMSTIYVAANDLTKSIEYNSKALNIYEKSASKDNQNYIISMMNRAAIYGRSENDLEAEKSFNAIFPLLHNLYGEKHKLIANMKQSLANTQINLGKYTEANNNLLASIKMYNELNFPIKDRVVTAYTSLAISYNRQGNSKKALQTYKALLENLQSEPEKDQKTIKEIQQLIQDFNKDI